MSFVGVFISSLSGYDAAITVKKLNKEKIHGIEKFAEFIPQLIDDFCSENNIILSSEERTNVLKLFFGLHSPSHQFFLFEAIEIELILKIVVFIQRTLDTNDSSYAAFEDGGITIADVTVNTPIGRLFYCDGK